MIRLKSLSAVAVLLSLLPGALVAQELFVYPTKGQSAEQQEQDKFQCYTFAKGQTGFDPMAPPTTSTAPPPAEAPQGGVARGGLRGALGGAAIGAIAGDTKQGLKIGAASVGTPECAVISGAVARLARYYALPSYVAGG